MPPCSPACASTSLRLAAHQHSCPSASLHTHAPLLRWESAMYCKSLATLCVAAWVSTAAVPPHACAYVVRESEAAQRAWALNQLGGRYAPPRSAPSLDQEPTSVRFQRLQQLSQAGAAAADDGNYGAALACYDAVVAQFPDLAVTEYARLSRGLMLYQLGRASDAILQLQDLEVALRGYAEVHAALAAMLYVERPLLLQQAEQQWAIAMEFNKSFADPEWVAATKHWPPRLMAALDRFLRLQ